METLLIYFAKSSALMALFFLIYHFLLRKETFFKSNRWYLLFGLVISVALPLVTFKKIVWIEPSGKGIDWNTMTETVPYTSVPVVETFEIDWFLTTLLAYAIGTLVFLLKFFVDFRALSKMLRGKQIQRQEDYKFVDLNENVSPFSYFSYIVYNSALYSPAELESILEHEKVHSSQNHTIDVLIARVFCILFWYNPFAWMYKKAILQNLEFIADSEAAKNISDIKAYQRTLLKITTHDSCVLLTNHFYQSLIKKRIVMLNKSQSKKWNSWKYSLVIPALLLFMFYFQVQMIAQEKQAPQVMVIAQDGIEVVVNKNSSDADLKKEAERVKKEDGINLKFSKIKRNKSGEIIAIKAEFKDKGGQKGTTQISGDEPIKPIRFYKNGEKIGFAAAGEKRVYAITNRNSEDAYSYSFGTPEAPEAPEAPETPETPEYFESLKSLQSLKSLESLKSLQGSFSFSTDDSNGNPIIFINGEMIDINPEKIMAEIDPNMIESIRILKSDVNGVKNSDGVIYIDTKKISKEAMKNVQEEIKKAKIEIERAKPEIERAKREIELSKPEIEKAKIEIAKAKVEIELAKVEMQKAKIEMEKAKIEIEKAKAELKKQKENKK